MAQIIQQQNILHFSGNLLITNISETLLQLQSLQLAAPLVLDFSQVQAVDTVAVSLVLEIQRRMHKEHPDAIQVSIVGVPDNLRSLMQVYGVDQFLLN